MHIPVHSAWLLGYIDVTQTVSVILTMAGFLQTDLVLSYDMFIFFIPKAIYFES